MRKYVLMGLLFLQAAIMFSQAPGNYPTQNGTIMEQKKEGDFEITIRRHQQEIIVDMYDRSPINVYNEPNREDNVIYRITDNLTIRTSQILTKIHSHDGDADEIWVKVAVNNNQGWIRIGRSRCSDPYWNNNGMISEIFNVNGTTLTALISAFNPVLEVLVDEELGLSVKSRPGRGDSEVLFFLHRSEKVEILEMTFEREHIGTKMARWLKIKNEDGKIGWVFGDYVGLEKGGGWWEQMPEERLRSFFRFYT